jgi:class 3 adenylate cyclase
LYKGLRVRMGAHLGSARVVRDPMTRRVEYIGPVVNTAARITAMTHGGQIVLSHAVHARLHLDEQAAAAAGNDEAATAAPAPVDLRERLVAMGHFEMPDAPSGAPLRHVTSSPFLRLLKLTPI